MPAATVPAPSPPPAVVAIDCPELGDEPRAAFEARAKAELLVRQMDGTLVVYCREGDARMSWHPIGMKEVEAAVRLDSDPRSATERLLDALDRLLSAPPPEHPSPAPPSAAGPPPTPDPSARVQDPPPRREASLPPPRSLAVTPAAGLEVGVGATGELWSSRVIGAAGPRVSIAAVAPVGLVAAARVHYLWGFTSVDGVSARVLRLEADAAYRFGASDRFEVGASVLAEAAHASAGTGVATADQWAFGGGVFASGAILTGTARLSAGPFLMVHPGGVRFELGAEEAFRIPAVTGGIFVEGVLELF